MVIWLAPKSVSIVAEPPITSDHTECRIRGSGRKSVKSIRFPFSAVAQTWDVMACYGEETRRLKPIPWPQSWCSSGTAAAGFSL